MKSLTSILFGLWLLETVQSIFLIEKMVHVYLYNWNSMFNVRNWRSAKNAASLLWLFEWEQFCSSNNNNSVNTVHDFRMLSEARQSCNYDTHLCTCSMRILISPGLVIPDKSDRRKWWENMYRVADKMSMPKIMQRNGFRDCEDDSQT